MIPIPSGVKVWLATGYTDMRKGFPGLALMVQETLKRNPHSGHLFCFRGRRGGLIKVIWHDGQGASRACCHERADQHAVEAFYAHLAKEPCFVAPVTAAKTGFTTGTRS